MCFSCHFQKISKVESAKHIWDILEQTYRNIGRVKKVRLQSLKRQFELLFMIDQESVCDYLCKIQEIANSMRGCDEKLPDSKVVEKIMRTLTLAFDHIVVAIEESKDLDAMTVEELQNSLEAHEQWLLSRKDKKKLVEQVSNYWQRQRKNGWKKKEEQEGVNQVTVLVQAIRPKVKTMCRGRSWLLSKGVKFMDPRNSMIKENCSVTIVICMVILKLNVGELITVTTQ